jgi:hypothetical protein
MKDETFEGVFRSLLISYTKEAVSGGWRRYPYFYTSIKILEISGWDAEVHPGDDKFHDSFRDLPLRLTDVDGIAVSHVEIPVEDMNENFKRYSMDFYTDDDGETRVKVLWREPDGE